MIRVFSALLPSAAAREHLVHTLRPIHAATTNELRWTDPDNWHVTMAFYGDQPNDAAAVREHLAHAVAGRSALDVRLSGAGSFEQRTLWLGLGGQVRGVRELMADCQLADVPFNHHRPHLSRGRWRILRAPYRCIGDRNFAWTGSALCNRTWARAAAAGRATRY